MKITSVEPMLVDRYLFVKIGTDAGFVGVGESGLSSRELAVAGAVEHLTSFLVGKNPFQIERLWRKMYRGLIYIGRRGIALHALSGIDIALWDIKGKAEGKPVHELLGGAKREEVRAYASRLMPDTPEETAEAVSALRDDGFTAVKLGWGPLGQDPVHDVRLAAAAKEAAGAECEILIDAGFGYVADAKTAIGVARELEQLGIFWLEEPFEPDEYEAYAELADAVEIRVAAGEQDTTVWGFRELIERGHVDLVQPDVTRCGGITEWLRIAELARSRGVETVPHAWKSGIIKAASLQCNAVIPDALFQEYCVADTPINQTLTHERLPVQNGGTIRIPTAPGIGVTLDDEVVAHYRVN